MGDERDEMGPGYLVYVKSMVGRVWPEWWQELYFGERGDRRASVVAIFPLDASDAGLSLKELARRHPIDAPHYWGEK